METYVYIVIYRVLGNDFFDIIGAFSSWEAAVCFIESNFPSYKIDTYNYTNDCSWIDGDNYLQVFTQLVQQE